MSDDVTIRPVRADEVAQLLALSRKTFFDAFFHRNSPEDMVLYADAAFKIEKLEAELQNPDSNFYYAEINSTPVGYLKLNRNAAQTDVHDAVALEIERIYVDADYQGKRIGARLLEFAMAYARECQASYIWLGVWEHNTQAIKFYERNGFEIFGSHQFMLGNDRQTDLLMKRGMESESRVENQEVRVN